ncbi:MAG TPA: FadR/GntR family transcriptional regulator [Patescibacteria group bacterium]|nr:FadR/GntR family transcriptional regulator [Patescibacteria group bacterium]
MEPIKKISVVDSVVAAMLTAIQNGRFTPGRKIPSERVLTQEFGVSRTALREAFQKLEQLGKITIRQGDGTYLNPPAPENIRDELCLAFDLGTAGMNQYLEARESLETAATRLAIERATPHEIEKLGRLLQEQEEQLNNTTAFAELDFKFHHTLMQTAKNKIILQFWLSIAPLIREQQDRVAPIPGMNVRAFKDHVKIVACISRNTPKQAQGLIQKHLSMVLGDLLTGISLRLDAGSKNTTEK